MTFFNTVPFLKKDLVTILFLETRFISCSSTEIFFFEVPIIISNSLILFMSFLNWLISIDDRWSGPFNFLESVICFSITQAPAATAAKHASLPIEWSEYPTFNLKNFFNFLTNLIFKIFFFCWIYAYAM